jgi:hypothetical protein
MPQFAEEAKRFWSVLIWLLNKSLHERDELVGVAKG